MGKFDELKKLEFTSRQKEIIDGTLLGDGCLTKLIPKQFINSRISITHGMKQYGYTEWFYNELSPFSRPIRIYSHKAPEIKDNKVVLSATKTLKGNTCETITHSYLTELEKKWYLRDGNGDYILGNKRRIKIIPNDLKLTPLALAIWYFDDGTNSVIYHKERDAYSNSIILFTLSFTKDECEFLSELIKPFGIDSYVRKTTNYFIDRFEIRINNKNYINFIDLIKPYVPHECLSYKASTFGYEYNKFKKENAIPRFLPFNEAREFAKKLLLKDRDEWKRYASSGNRPINIPSRPENIYAEWKGYEYWLGTNWMDFEEARLFVRKLNLIGYKAWKQYYKSPSRHKNIPVKPDMVYKDQWLGWGDWLGTYHLTNKEKQRQFKPFPEARLFAVSLNLTSKDQWKKFIKNNKKLNDIPADPQSAYKDKGWQGWAHWLGNKSEK